MKTPLMPLIVLLSVPVFAAAADNSTAATPNTTVEKWTCEEFLAIDEQFKPKAVYWASAHSKMGKKDKEKVLNIEGTEQVIPMVIDECTEAPKATFWQKLKASWEKAEHSAKAEMKAIKSDLGHVKDKITSKPAK